MEAPAMKLTLVIEGSPGSQPGAANYSRDAARAAYRPSSPSRRFRNPTSELHERNIFAISTSFARRAPVTKALSSFDLVEYGIEGYNKFIPYYSFRTRPIRFQFLHPLSARRFQLDQIRGYASRSGTTLRQSASDMAAAATPKLARSAFPSGPSTRREKRLPK